MAAWWMSLRVPGHWVPAAEVPRGRWLRPACMAGHQHDCRCAALLAGRALCAWVGCTQLHPGRGMWRSLWMCLVVLLGRVLNVGRREAGGWLGQVGTYGVHVDGLCEEIGRIKGDGMVCLGH